MFVGKRAQSLVVKEFFTHTSKWPEIYLKDEGDASLLHVGVGKGLCRFTVDRGGGEAVEGELCPILLAVTVVVHGRFW